MKRTNPQSRTKRPLVAAIAFAATWLALPVTSVMAQSFPEYPLQTGAGNVEPNIMFVLDDSGSMAFDDMDNPDIGDIETCVDRGRRSCNDWLDITDETYVANTLYYNPAQNYRPWMQASGSRMTGGTTMGSVFASNNFAGAGYGGESDTIDLMDSSDCETYDRNGNNNEICGRSVHTYFVPKDTSNTTESYLEDAINYYRYQIRTVNGAVRVIRSELVAGGNYGDFGATTSVLHSVNNFSRTQGNTYEFDTTLTQNYSNLTAVTSGNNGDADLYIDRWTGSSWNRVCTSQGNNSNETCSIDPDQARYRVVVYAWSSFNNVDLEVRVTSGGESVGCAPTTDDYGWGNCTYAVPVAGRTEAQELSSFATWFSYHRTRMKVAKAGAAEAFHQLGNNVRVGFRSLHQNNGNTNYNIPVEDGNNGVFESTARSTWFDKLFNARGQSGTPLRAALQNTGNYFTSTSSSGPYGPGATANQLACRQNFAIMTTDGFWNGGYDNAVGDQEGSDGPSIENPSDNTDVVRYTVSHPFRDGASANYSNTLADVAMRYWKYDLRDNLDNIVPTSTSNPAFWQHMVTFGVSIGLKGTVDQTSVADVLAAGRPRINGVAVDWPDPTDGENAERIDDLLHASVNGRGEFIAASNAEDFGTALNSVLGQIQSRLASGSNVATNSTSYQSNSRIYQATYRSVQWTGELASIPISASGIGSTPSWLVTAQIADTYTDADAGNDYHNRTVLTWNGTQGAAFPTGAQATALTRDTGSAQVSGANNASYIKGNPALERANGGTLRNRSVRLGDIINSSPFYVADTETIYVGANDGMLHGIDALTGDVEFSYVPAGLNFSRLKDLSDPAYAHAYFVDGQVSVSTSRVTPGENFLVGALGRGGKGVFALDVTDPASMSGGNNGDVLWDKTATADADMGYVLGTPVIVKANNGDVVALVPNGIESTNGDAVLYVYEVETGDLLAKISTGNTTGNGLSTPRTADLDADGDVDYVYAGDLLGNMWKFDLSSANENDWAVAYGGTPLFVARTAGGGVQPITGTPALARETAENRIWVTFGTGRFIYESDVGNTDIQTWYGVIDDEQADLRRSDLTERQIAATGTDAQGRPVRGFEAYEELPADSMGWFVDLDEPLDGERVIGSARVNGRAAIVSSMAPTISSGCENEGAGFLNAIDMFTGTSPEDSSGGGAASFFDIDGDGTGTSDGDFIEDADGNPVGVGSLDTGVGAHYDSRNVDGDYVICGSNGTCELVDGGENEGGAGESKRLSWRELFEED
ncbi:MAG TPA: PilC/PilY family type IV pilus protein [Arenimonas sp.]